MSNTLSPQTIERLNDYRLGQYDYEQSQAGRLQLAAKTVIAFVGAACEGKNSIMDAVTELDDRFKTIGTVTTRPPRPSDVGVPYSYFSHTDEGLQSLFEAIDGRKLVQYFVAEKEPYYMYGSRLADYPGIFNVGDYFADSIADMRNRGFGRVIACSVISTPMVWQKRFDERFPVGSPLRAWRLDESISSWKWSLDQEQATDHYWIVNEQSKLKAAAQAVVGCLEGVAGRKEDARAMALDSISLAEKMSV